MGHGIPDPAGRREPDEAEDRDHHHVVLPGRAIERPEEDVPQHPDRQRRADDQGRALGHFFEHAIGQDHPVDDREDREHQDHPEHAGHAVA